MHGRHHTSTRTRTRSTSTPLQRLQWRLRKAEQRQRQNNRLFPGSKRRDPISVIHVPLPKSAIDSYAARLIAERGRDDSEMPTAEYHNLVGEIIAEDIKDLIKTRVKK